MAFSVNTNAEKHKEQEKGKWKEINEDSKIENKDTPEEKRVGPWFQCRASSSVAFQKSLGKQNRLNAKIMRNNGGQLPQSAYNRAIADAGVTDWCNLTNEKGALMPWSPDMCFLALEYDNDFRQTVILAMAEGSSEDREDEEADKGN